MVWSAYKGVRVYYICMSNTVNSKKKNINILGSDSYYGTYPRRSKIPQITQANVPVTQVVDVTICAWQKGQFMDTGLSRKAIPAWCTTPGATTTTCCGPVIIHTQLMPVIVTTTSAEKSCTPFYSISQVIFFNLKFSIGKALIKLKQLI